MLVVDAVPPLKRVPGQRSRHRQLCRQPVLIRATPVRPLACAPLGESVVQTGLRYQVTLAAAAAPDHEMSARNAVVLLERLWRVDGT